MTLFLLFPHLFPMKWWGHVWCLFLSFWLISLCMTDCRSIHVSYKLPFTIRCKPYLGLFFCVFFCFFSFFPVSYVVWFKKHFSYKLRYSWPSTIYQKAMPFPTTLKYSFLLWIKWLSLFESVLDSLTKWSNNLYLQLYHLALIFVAL